MLDSKAFISHTEVGGSNVGQIILDQLNRPDLEMKAFLSKDAIEYGEHIHEKILQFLVNTDLLFIIIEPVVISSDWVKWEYDFCKKRGIERIPIVFSQFLTKLHKVDWFDDSEKHLPYNGDEGIFRAEIYKSVDDNRITLEQRATDRNKIILTVKPSKKSYSENDKVKIDGNVQTSLIGSAFLHIPHLKKEYPPIMTIDLNSITPDGNGDFNFEFDLPSSPITTERIQKWFIEIKFDTKSELIPIIISPKGTDTIGSKGDVKPSHDGSSLQIQKKTWKEKIKNISSGTFQSIPKTINEYTIPRKNELSTLIEYAQNHERTVIIGNKGTGKSVLLCHLYQDLEKRKKDTLFLRCDDYLNIETVNDLQKIIDPENNFDFIISKTYSESNKLTIIFDSLDAISRNTKTIGIFKQFLKILWGTNKVKTICSVRSYDYEYSPSIKNTDWGTEFNLKELSEKQLHDTLNYLKNPKISHHLENILKNPLHLKLLSMILEKSPQADFTQITNEVELYNEHWREYVEKSNKPLETRNTLFSISKKMIESQRVVVPFAEFHSEEGMHEVLNTNIIEHDSATGLIQFFHHAYLDYVISRYVILNYTNFVKFLSEEEYNIFLRPSIVFTLSILHNQNVINFMTNVNNILVSDLKYYWKISALHALAKIKDLKITDVEKFGALLDSDYSLQSHFLHEIAMEKNQHWFKIWEDTFFKKWFEKEQSNERVLLEYVKSILDFQQFHSKIFELIKSLVLKSKDPWAQKTAIELTSKLVSVDKFEWYLLLSNHENSYVKWGVLDCLSDFIETHPKNIHKIFVNIFLYRENSDDKTILPPYGSLLLTSNKRQDNQQTIWLAGELFPKLLEKNPKEMILATISIIESLQQDYLQKQKGTIVEDGGYIWYDTGDFRGLHDENKLLSSVENYLQKCGKEEFEDLLPILTKTRLATIHRIVISKMLDQPDYFKEYIFKEISNPECFMISTLEPVVLQALERTSKLLKDDQVKQLLDLIMNIEFPSKHTDSKALVILDRIKARFLSKISPDKLKKEHEELLGKFQKDDIKYVPPISFKIEAGKAPEEIPKLSPEKIIEEKIGKQLVDRNERIELLDSIVEYLGKKTEELDSVRLDTIEKYLLSQVDDPDPEESVEDKDSTFMIHYESIRGITSRGLIRLYYHTKNKKFEAPIRKLSNDSTNIVRGEIARELRYLFFVNYPLTLEIATRYSKEQNLRTNFHLADIVSVIANKHPNDSITLIRNILSLSKLKNFRQIQFHEGVIIYLALVKKVAEAKILLNDIMTNKEFPSEILQNIPFILKESYLFDIKTQDESLSIFLRLLENQDHKIREKATFFLLYPMSDKKAIVTHDLIGKIEQHLDKVALEIEREEWDLRIIEELMKFLESYWQFMPDKTIEYMEKLTEVEKKYLTFQPNLSRDAITILNGIFRDPNLSPATRKRCLNILDKFTKAGWVEALHLLESMERSD